MGGTECSKTPSRSRAADELVTLQDVASDVTKLPKVAQNIVE